MSSNLLYSLRYLEENSSQIFNPSYPIIMNEVKRIVDSGDKFYIDNLLEIIKKRCYELTSTYYERCLRGTDYDIEIESLKKLEEFWGMYDEFHSNKKFVKKLAKDRVDVHTPFR